MNRRDVLVGTGALAMAGAVPGARGQAGAATGGVTPSRLPIRLALKYGMVAGDAPMVDKFKMVRDLGYDGIELDSPSERYGHDEVRAAIEASGLPVHGVVDSIHWNLRLSSPDQETREKGVEGLLTAIRDSRAYGGSAVLLVPGVVADPERENHDQVWQRSMEGIRRALPLAAEMGQHILIENVWNRFCYVHDGPHDQTAHTLAGYIDEIGSPWVGSYYDIGNHRRYGRPEQWIRTLGRRIVKLDVKGWGMENGWCEIGSGDIDWPAVCESLRAIGYCGWATAEVGGGDRAHLAGVLERMRRVFELD